MAVAKEAPKITKPRKSLLSGRNVSLNCSPRRFLSIFSKRQINRFGVGTACAWRSNNCHNTFGLQSIHIQRFTSWGLRGKAGTRSPCTLLKFVLRKFTACVGDGGGFQDPCVLWMPLNNPWNIAEKVLAGHKCQGAKPNFSWASPATLYRGLRSLGALKNCRFSYRIGVISKQGGNDSANGVNLF